MKINIDSVMQKVESYARSTNGKKRMSEYIEWCINNGKDVSDAGSKIMTKEKMCFLAETMISILQNEASSHSLPQSVLDHFDSLTYDDPTKTDDRHYFVKIYFRDDLSRPSLGIVMWAGNGWHTTGARTGEGIDDIISLFNTGYQADNTSVYGYWDSVGKVVSALPERKPLHFMEQSVELFKQQYGRDFNVDVYLCPFDD